MNATFTSWMARLGGLLAAVGLLCTTPAAAQAPAWQWGLQSTNPNSTDSSYAAGMALATDAAGRVYVGGTFDSGAPGRPGATRQFAGAGPAVPGRGGFVAQATAGGQWAWVVPVLAQGPSTFGQATAEVTGVAVGANGDVYISGTVAASGVAVGNVSQPLPSPGAALFVARLNSAGQCQWVQVVAGGFRVPVLAPDPSTGGLVMACTYYGSPTIGGVALPPVLVGSSRLPCVARLTAAGQFTTAATPTGVVEMVGEVGLAVGPAGQVALAAQFVGGTLAFGSIRQTSRVGCDGSYLVAQLSPANQWDWARSNDTGRESAATGVAYAANGDLWVSGFGGTGTVVGPLPLVAGPTVFTLHTAGFVGRLSATGQWQAAWQVSPNGVGTVAFAGLRLDGQERPVAIGTLRGVFGPVQAPVGSQVLVAAQDENQYFAARLDGAGQWQLLATVPLATIANGLRTGQPVRSPGFTALDRNGNLYLTGILSGSLALGNTLLSGTVGKASPFNRSGDAVLLKLANAAAPLATRAPALTALALYPSPAHHTATLRLPAPAATPETVSIVDNLGRPVQTANLLAGALETTLNLTGLAPGLYLVRVGAATARLVVE